MEGRRGKGYDSPEVLRAEAMMLSRKLERQIQERLLIVQGLKVYLAGKQQRRHAKLENGQTRGINRCGDSVSINVGDMKIEVCCDGAAGHRGPHEADLSDVEHCPHKTLIWLGSNAWSVKAKKTAITRH